MGETLLVRRLESESSARIERLETQVGLRAPKLVMEDSDSLFYLAVWARRGKGVSAPWHMAGFAYTSRDPANQSAWLVGRTGPTRGIGLPHAGRYKHLEGRWYFYSMLLR